MATKKYPQARPLGFTESKGNNLVLYRHRKPRLYNKGYYVNLMAFGHDADLLQLVDNYINFYYRRYHITTGWGANNEFTIASNALPYIRKACKEKGIKLTVIECNQKMYKHYQEGKDKLWAIINKKFL